MIAAGAWLDRGAFTQFRQIVRLSGQAPSDFIALAGAAPTFVNMGVSGFVSTAYVLVIGADLNGPVIGAILSVVGFAAYGKHPVNFVPVMAGVFLVSFWNVPGAAAPGIVLAALFGTTPAPISGKFGWYWGIIAGCIHVSVAQTVGVVHGGLNLYNNGFAAGLVAALLAPVIIAVNARFEARPAEKI